VNLILRCCRDGEGELGDDRERLKNVVVKLMSHTNVLDAATISHTSPLSTNAAAKKLLALVFSKRPLEVADVVPRRLELALGSFEESASSFVSGSSPYDAIIHVVVTSLGAATQRGKEWAERIGSYDAALRRIASRCPALVLRHLPSLAATLRGRAVASRFLVFRSQNHLRLFQLALDLMNEALIPDIFRPAYAEPVFDICQSFGQMFST
jgi:hypothetical protein